MIDMIVQASTRFAMQQWLDARGLGTLEQDTDPESPTFGEWLYTHDTSTSDFVWYKGGQLPQSVDRTDPENPVVTMFNGVWGLLRFRDAPIPIQDWMVSSTAPVTVEGFPGAGGEGIVLVQPEKVTEHLNTIGEPGHVWLSGTQWSDPLLATVPAMTGDQRDFDGVTYESRIDWNVWNPTNYPAGWTEIGASGPATQEWEAGLNVSVGEQYTYQGTTYEVTQAHTTQVGWEPPNVPALWNAI